MLFRQLEYFCAIARTSNYRQAANELHVSQSAISQQVKALEEELGQALTKREGRGFKLTPAGELLARKGQRIIEEAVQLKHELKSFDSTPQQLRVGYLNRYSGWDVQTAVAAFSRRRPEITVSATSASHDELYQQAIDGKLDILVNDRRRELSDEWENHLLFRGYDYLEVSEGSPLAWHESLTLSQLRDERCILVTGASQQEAEAAYYRDTLGYPCSFAFASSTEEARMMVAANQGVFPTESRNDRPRTGTVIRRIPLVDATGTHRFHEYYAFWPKARTSKTVEEFARILEELLGQKR